MRIETVGGKDEVKAQLNLMREVRTDEERKVHHDAQYITTFPLTQPLHLPFRRVSGKRRSPRSTATKELTRSFAH